MKRIGLCSVALFCLTLTNWAGAQELLSTQPTTRPDASPTTQLLGADVDITIDSSQAPDLKDWCEKELRPALEKWYPLIVADLPSNGFTAPRKFTVVVDPSYRGVAATGGTRVMVSPDWIKSQSLRQGWNEAVGSVIHEEVHVVQQYGYGRRFRGATSNPVWLVEGIADYIRWFKYEPEDKRPHPSPIVRIAAGGGRGRGRGRNQTQPAQSQPAQTQPVQTQPTTRPANYTDSYRTTAAFLNYVADKHDHEIVVKLNASMRDGRYRPELWSLYTGKTVEELWAEYYETLTR
jgi:hypothetical protein